MIAAALLAAALSQDLCRTALRDARALAVVMDMAGAMTRLRTADATGCDVETPLALLRGLVDGRTAVARGGDDASLRPLRALADAIEAHARSGSPEEIAALLLRALIAAAQNERDELFAYLSQALQVERGRGAQGLPGAPILSAHELAGELWLDVHRYDDAVAAFQTARAATGDTPRLTAGLARALLRVRDTRGACVEYRRLTSEPAARRPSMDRELEEANRILAQPGCRDAIGR